MNNITLSVKLRPIKPMPSLFEGLVELGRVTAGNRLTNGKNAGGQGVLFHGTIKQFRLNLVDNYTCINEEILNAGYDGSFNCRFSGRYS
jgi:hypothetical protein